MSFSVWDLLFEWMDILVLALINIFILDKK